MRQDMGMGNNMSCPNCKQPFQARVEQILDVGRDPSAKSRLLSGQVNVAVCPSCGFRAGIGTPMLYHDPAKELLLVYVPMELGLQQAEQEKVVGELVRHLMNSLPTEGRRGYLFQPKSVLSAQGLYETILQADGITPEMLEAQRVKVRLVETFLQTDADELPALIQQHDDQIDVEMLDIITAAAQNAAQSGRQDMAEHALKVREVLLELSTVGKQALQDAERQEEAIQQVAQAIQGLGESPTPDDFMDLVVGMAGNDDKLQAIVGMQFPLFDYEFFQSLAGRIEKASDGAKSELTALRDRLVELTSIINQQQQAVAQAAAGLLREIVQSEDIETAVRNNLGRIDDTFMMVLSANLQAAEEKKDFISSARLKQISETVMRVYQESAPPVLQFISELLQSGTLEDALGELDTRAAEHGPALVELMDALLGDLKARGDAAMSERLQVLRQHAVTIVGEPAVG